jgi:hypothetical protein
MEKPLAKLQRGEIDWAKGHFSPGLHSAAYTGATRYWEWWTLGRQAGIRIRKDREPFVFGGAGAIDLASDGTTDGYSDPGVTLEGSWFMEWDLPNLLNPQETVSLPQLIEDNSSATGSWLGGFKIIPATATSLPQLQIYIYNLAATVGANSICRVNTNLDATWFIQ